MSEWSIEHAWKLTPAARADAYEIPPTHVRSSSSRYNEVLHDAAVSDVVHRGFRGVCDTVLTQNQIPFRGVSISTSQYALDSLTMMVPRSMFIPQTNLISRELVCVHSHLAHRSQELNCADAAQNDSHPQKQNLRPY
jgi:hypothetical protein